MSAQSSLFVCGHKFGPRMRARFDSSRITRKTTAREHTKLKGVLRFRRPARNSAHSKRQTYSLGFDSERLTRLCGTGVPFRPLFAPIPSCNVPGVKILPTTRAKTSPDALLHGQTTPDKTESIEKFYERVKSDSQLAEEKLGAKVRVSTRPAEGQFREAEGKGQAKAGWVG